MKRIDKVNVVTEIKANEDVAILVKDAIETINQAYHLEKQLTSDNVFGNNTLSVEAKLDAVYTKQMIDTCYDVARYDCIEELNELLGGNVIDMTGTDKQVCKRFYREFHLYVA